MCNISKVILLQLAAIMLLNFKLHKTYPIFREVYLLIFFLSQKLHNTNNVFFVYKITFFGNDIFHEFYLNFILYNFRFNYKKN